jgi:lysophospholipase L1-like esterase
MVSRRSLLGGFITIPLWRASAVKGEVGGGHIVLLGDSIFDNAAYVGGGPDVLAQLRAALPQGWKATLRAVDGATVRDVADQLSELPTDTTHVIVSAGGNDALMHQSFLEEKASSVAGVLSALATIREEFHRDYRKMLDRILELKLPTAICTIYDANYAEPEMKKIANTGLAIFNDVITREAAVRKVPIIDLRTLFTSPADYANPIEPSAIGGEKIASAISQLVATGFKSFHP